MTARRKADIVADRLAEIETFYVIVDGGNFYFSRNETWSSDYDLAMRFQTREAASFEMRALPGTLYVVGPCIEGEAP